MANNIDKTRTIQKVKVIAACDPIISNAKSSTSSEESSENIERDLMQTPTYVADRGAV